MHLFGHGIAWEQTLQNPNNGCLILSIASKGRLFREITIYVYVWFFQGPCLRLLSESEMVEQREPCERLWLQQVPPQLLQGTP